MARCGAGRAEAGADVLASGRYPAGHLTHMAGHTYLRLGRWADTQRAQEKALKQDEGDVAKYAPHAPLHACTARPPAWGAARAVTTGMNQGRLNALKERQASSAVDQRHCWALACLWHV